METKVLGDFIQELTPTSENAIIDAPKEESIVYIDVEELESNPNNFYGLRNIDELAGLIAVSHFVEPLTVFQKSDGKFMIISGHRRCAAVKKLLESEGYDNRKVPCIVKAQEKISIEQENGETVEFDEDAVNMLHLIASNRGQREERTVDEKLQEVKFLEKFAKAIYHQKDRGTRGRFRTFFAEEILNISKSQLQRINSMEKLTETVKRAVDAKTISETAAMEMASMSPEDQNICLGKILSGEIKGTVQDIQKWKTDKDNKAQSLPENVADDNLEEIEKSATEQDSSETSLQIDKCVSEKSDDVGEKLIYPKNLLPQNESTAQNKESNTTVDKMIEVPEEFEDPQKEAEEWFYRERLAFYEMIYNEAKRRSAEEPNELKAAQWGIRASVALYNIEELKLHFGG